MFQDLKVVQTREEKDGLIRLVQATPAQTADIVALLVEAAEWMVENELKHWTPDLFTEDSVRAYFNDRDVYVAYFNETPVGLFTLQGSDPSYWGPLNDEAFGYLHRLTVSRSYRKRGLSLWMLNAAEEIVLAAGKKGLRLDCITHSPKLNEFYQGQGFIHQGVTDMGVRVVNLYQR
ncbi:GNAT family N-acetyltransferase [Paenibacillus sp. Marseille-Q4541]|uniref:GNAT family N-acetyltransferase n=1 Tax=Paenibacillus sp. Marseille-Q4541 TaxID=2831522 RepID=UPI001BA56352|nr:GNAT family N-acetyltransferase [Paenibacillus sp. Marseille-Q4541]